MKKTIFSRNKKGQMLVLAAVSLTALIALAGLGIDMSNLIMVNYKLQRALDAAMLNTLVYTEQSISRGVKSKDLVNNATEFAKDVTISNLRMMGVRREWPYYLWNQDRYLTQAGERVLIMDPEIDPETGIHIMVNGKDVITEKTITDYETSCEETSSGGCEKVTTTSTHTVTVNEFLKNVSSIKICITAKLKVDPLLMRMFGFGNMYLKATSCSRRTMAAIVMLLDTSGSMDGKPLANLKTGAKAFIDQFQESIDMISIVTFNTRATVIQPMMRISMASYGDQLGKDALKTMIDNLTASGETNIPLALYYARKELEIGTKVPAPIGNEPPPFRTIVLFTDGAPTAMTVDFTDSYTSIPWQLSQPVKGPSGTFDDKRWDPSEWGPLPQNNSVDVDHTFDYSGDNKHIYTYRAGLYEAGSLLFRADDPNSTPPPCSSENKVHLLWGSNFIYNDPSDCLRSMSFKDSKGEAHDLDFHLWIPYPYKFPTHINNHDLDVRGRYDMKLDSGFWVYIDSGYYGWEGQPAWWGNSYASGGQSSGHNVEAMRLPYIEAIIEGDYSLADNITIYAVGLSQVKVPCGPASDPYLPCCGPGSQDINHDEIPCVQPVPCVENDPRPSCHPCDPATDINHCQPKDSGKGIGS